MQFTTLSIVAAAVASVSAQVSLTDTTYGGITVGTPFDVTWGDAVGSVALVLRVGDPNNLQTVSTITTGLPVPTGSYEWTPSSDLPAGNYAIEIVDAVTSNFGALFQLLGATASATTTSAVSAPTTTTASTTTSGSASTTTSTGSTTTATSTGSSSDSSSTASKTSSKTSSSTTSSTSSTSSPKNTNSAAGLSSPLAMVFLSVAAMVLFN